MANDWDSRLEDEFNAWKEDFRWKPFLIGFVIGLIPTILVLLNWWELPFKF